MEMENERSLPLPRDTVWEALNDPGVLRACIPGCESFDRVEENTYDALVSMKVGPVKARFSGRVTLEDLNPPESYSLSFQGQGGQAGFARGSASVRLEEAGGGCRLVYSVKATLGGKLAQLGSRLIDSAAQKTAKDFFDNFVGHMGADEASGGPEAAGAGEAEAAAGSGSARVWPWVVAGAIVVAAAVIAFL